MITYAMVKNQKKKNFLAWSCILIFCQNEKLYSFHARKPFYENI